MHKHIINYIILKYNRLKIFTVYISRGNRYGSINSIINDKEILKYGKVSIEIIHI